MIEINCETDFVTKNDSFLALANAAAMLVAKHNPADLAALGALPYEQDGFGPTLEDVRKGLIGKIGENMSFRRFKRFAGNGKLASYLHGTRIGVMVEFEGDDTAAKDVAMHIAAMKPVAISSSDVPADLIEKERAVAAGKAEEDRKAAEAAGKQPQPADIVAKRIEGGVQKYLKEVSLHNQPFVKNDKQTVEQMLKAANTSIKGFTLYVVGEGIEKKVDDFAAEVAAQVAAAKAARLSSPSRDGAHAAPPLFRLARLYTRPANLQRNPSMPEARPAHKRILLKLSGEALMGDDAFGINRATIVRMVARWPRW